MYPVILSALLCASIGAQLAVDLPEDVRARFKNPDGSCVQCSIGILGADQNVRPAELLLWDSVYGRAVRGGAGASRVREYCAERGIEAWIIEGDTWPWIEWALKTGRGCAVTYGTGHVLTAVGISGDWIALCDNNSPRRIDWVRRDLFLREHEPYCRQCRRRHEGFCLILKAPPAPGREPTYLRWWEP